MIIRKNDKIAILGFGLEGKDVLDYLLKNGFSNITIFDRKRAGELNLNGIDLSKIKIVSGTNYLKNGLKGFKTIVRSPGVYRYIPELHEAESEGCEITSNIKIFMDEFKGKVIGVTGTKGKGTTSSLIYKILKLSGKDVYLAGNIGTPPLSILGRDNIDSLAVLELSSFQLIDINKSPHIAVVLNITSDHMDWHKNQKEYVDSKKNIVKYQKRSDFKVLNIDYDLSKSFSGLSSSKTYFFSKKEKVNGAYVQNANIYLSIEKKIQKIGNVRNLLLRGEHNWENICASICASYIAGAGVENIKNAVFSFKGLEHRLEFVGTFRGINFYDDSFSTNPQTTIAALNSFDDPLTIILGGFDKKLDYDEMSRVIKEKKNIENVVLIGDISRKIKYSLIKIGYKRKLIEMGKSSMKDIVKICIKNTLKGGVILLSPAASSFDMFKDYKDRGDQYKKAVFNINEKKT